MSGRIVISLGSNIDDKEQQIRSALSWCEGKLSNFRCSHIYETPAEGQGYGDALYMNAVAIGDLQGSLQVFEQSTKEYELQNGRDAEARMRKEVPIDLDIVLLNDEVLRPFDYSSTFFKIGFNYLNCQ